jgi:ergothioneine biosynthesis protein EgtB
MPSPVPAETAQRGIDSPAIRQAGRDTLSLALMDARNHTLQLLSVFEQALGPAVTQPLAAEPPVAWTAGHVGWLAEYWIARNPQRGQGLACPPGPTRLASVEPQADGWFHPRLRAAEGAWPADLPELNTVRAYLLDTFETTQDLLDKAAEDDRGLHFFRMALWHEDARSEQLVTLAQTLGIALPLQLPAGGATREPIALPATRWSLGWRDGGFARDIERGELAVDVPEFEIDAQPVTWAQYVEFIDDGGYDREELWSAPGWQWLQQQAAGEGRRGPRHVEQIGVASGAVMQTIFGKPTRLGASQFAMHVSWWEADAYARWAGRRLPTEVEWEIAVHAATRRGFRWGDVWEWTAGTLKPWPGFTPDVWAADAALDAQPAFGVASALRGASFATRARMKHPKARAWAMRDDDRGFTGFRTCTA